MPIETATLDAMVRAYVSTMTSIRGRRIHRLLMREFARFDDVLPATAEDGVPCCSKRSRRRGIRSHSGSSGTRSGRRCVSMHAATNASNSSVGAFVAACIEARATDYTQLPAQIPTAP